ncbi:MAG: hypothetical protein DRN17_01350 [Thermoplasmata archaeon]|nr:MAG: hypothetical protein DRN17_01350 [Thermoplasmata archaeon]
MLQKVAVFLKIFIKIYILHSANNFGMISAKMFARSIIALARVCEDDPEKVDARLLKKLREFGYIDEDGKLTEYGKKLLRYIIYNKEYFYDNFEL